MGFYQELSRFYDEIFAVGEQELAFLNGELSFLNTRPDGKRRLLDIGCGTGNKTELFAGGRNGVPARQVTGIDGDPAMIALARERHAAPGVRYEVLDMLDILPSFAPAAFDAVLCLGNTLVHLDGPQSIGKMLGKMREALDYQKHHEHQEHQSRRDCRDSHDNQERQGLCAIQILNYDYILDENVSELPVLDTPGARFLRRYRRRGKLLDFETELQVKEDGSVLRNSLPLYPLRRAELARLLERAGFGTVEYYGGYGGGPLEKNSFVLIALCR